MDRYFTIVPLKVQREHPSIFVYFSTARGRRADLRNRSTLVVLVVANKLLGLSGLGKKTFFNGKLKN